MASRRVRSYGSKKDDSDVPYFESYSHLGIHQEMIRDAVRTNAYEEAILKNKDFIKGKSVLDVGCGTAILSVFAVRAGARQVYAVEASDMAIKAREVVKANGFADVIKVIHGKVEEVELPEKVDVIISEWMGYALLYESMLGSVLFARDKWLQPGGLMLPTRATIYLAPVTHEERFSDAVDFWKDVYGIDMSVLIPDAKKSFLGEPTIDFLTAENVLAEPEMVRSIDCRNVTLEEVSNVDSPFSLSCMMSAPLHGFALWFDVEFDCFSGIGQKFPENPAENPAGNPAGFPAGIPGTNGKVTGVGGRRKKKGREGEVVLSTAPEGEGTHWGQTVLYLDDAVEVDQDQVVSGRLRICQNKENTRFLDMEVEGRIGETTFSKSYMMQ